MKVDLPTRWFFTDDRLGDALWAILASLPPHVGVIARVKKSTSPESRAKLHQIVRLCHHQRRPVLVAGPIAQALALGATGAHLPEKEAVRLGIHQPLRRPHRNFILTMAAHTIPALVSATRLSVDAVFLSPVFATASHPEVRPLGMRRFGLMRKKTSVPVFALGGMDEAKAMQLARSRGLAGWGAIDAWRQQTFSAR